MVSQSTESFYCPGSRYNELEERDRAARGQDWTVIRPLLHQPSYRTEDRGAGGKGGRDLRTLSIFSWSIYSTSKIISISITI